jgi:hypothetical protein
MIEIVICLITGLIISLPFLIPYWFSLYIDKKVKQGIEEYFKNQKLN